MVELGCLIEDCQFGLVRLEVEDVPVLNEVWHTSEARDIDRVLLVDCLAVDSFFHDFADFCVVGVLVAEIVLFDEVLSLSDDIFPVVVSEVVVFRGNVLGEAHFL